MSSYFSKSNALDHFFFKLMPISRRCFAFFVTSLSPSSKRTSLNLGATSLLYCSNVDRGEKTERNLELVLFWFARLSLEIFAAHTFNPRGNVQCWWCCPRCQCHLLVVGIFFLSVWALECTESSRENLSIVNYTYHQLNQEKTVHTV